MDKSFVYLDYNATTPVAPEVVRIVAETMANIWGNPSSSYHLGVQAKEVIETARSQIKSMISCSEADNVVFTSGGTEASNVAVSSAIGDLGRSPKPHVISSPVEHDATLKQLEYLEKCNFIDVTYVKPENDGSIHPRKLLDAIECNTCLITVMVANNETGAITPLDKVCRDLAVINEKRIQDSKPKVFVHADAAQIIGKMPFTVQNCPVDYLTIVGHKFYGPRIGALYAKSGVPLKSIIKGGGQEKNLRPGTENTPCIAGLGEAARLVLERTEQFMSHFQSVKNHLEFLLKTEFPAGECVVNFPESLDGSGKRLPNTLSVSFRDVSGASMLKRCPGLAASTGAACHSTSVSSVLKLLLPLDQVIGTIRLSVGRETTVQDVELAVNMLKRAYLEEKNV